MNRVVKTRIGGEISIGLEISTALRGRDEARMLKIYVNGRITTMLFLFRGLLRNLLECLKALEAVEPFQIFNT